MGPGEGLPRISCTFVQTWGAWMALSTGPGLCGSNTSVSSLWACVAGILCSRAAGSCQLLQVNCCTGDPHQPGRHVFSPVPIFFGTGVVPTSFHMSLSPSFWAFGIGVLIMSWLLSLSLSLSLSLPVHVSLLRQGHAVRGGVYTSYLMRV